MFILASGPLLRLKLHLARKILVKLTGMKEHFRLDISYYDRRRQRGYALIELWFLLARTALVMPAHRTSSIMSNRLLIGSS